MADSACRFSSPACERKTGLNFSWDCQLVLCFRSSILISQTSYMYPPVRSFSQVKLPTYVVVITSDGGHGCLVVIGRPPCSALWCLDEASATPCINSAGDLEGFQVWSNLGDPSET